MDQKDYHMVKIGNDARLCCTLDLLSITIIVCRNQSGCSTVLITVQESFNPTREVHRMRQVIVSKYPATWLK